MIIPFITILKLIAIGSIKLIFLLLGIAFFPIFALRFILGGATSMLMPTLDWMEEHEKIDNAKHKAIVDDLTSLTSIEFTRKEARVILWTLIRKTCSNFVTSAKNGFVSSIDFVKKLFGR